MPRLSEEEYAQTMGHRCPMCESPDIETRSGYGVDLDYTRHSIRCNRCGAMWVDEHKLVGYTLKEKVDA
jgi:Zn-finger nucleic acid-binding protein